MNNKSSRKAKLSLILIVLFTFALLVLIVLASWRNNAATTLEAAVDDLGKRNQAVNLADSSIEKFFSIENSFRLYTATGQQVYRLQYVNGLRELTSMLAALEKSMSSTTYQKSSLQDLLKKKTLETKMFLRMKTISDSLMLATSDLKNFGSLNSPVFKPISRVEAGKFIERTTVVIAEPQPKKRLLGRIKDAISNKKEKQVATVTTTITKAEPVVGNQTDRTYKALNDLLRSSIDKLTFNHKQLGENEKRLLLSNDRLLTRLSSILRELKQVEIEIKNIKDQGLNQDAKVSLQELSKITKIIIFVSLLLALIILLNAWQLYKHDKKLLAAKNDAVRQTHIRGDFLAHMSHEIRTPLNSILGFSEQLENSSLNDVQKDQIQSIRQSSKILLSIVNDVLDLSKFETGNLNLHTSNFYPEKTVKHVVSSMYVIAEKKNIKLTCDCEMGTDFRLAGDEYRLKQVLINLINNAIKFTDSGGVKVIAKVRESTLVVEVSDTGRGIAAEHLKSIFDEFTQITKAQDNERHNGSGLGLAICKKIVEAQNGEIFVRSEVGVGSVFGFKIPYLPFQKSLETNIHTQIRPPLDIASIRSKTILVAEDDKMNIKLISTIFNKWGIKFDVVTNGTLAYESFERESYDMILTDIHMPEGDGITLTKRIREHKDRIKANVPVLAITANAMEKDLKEYKAIGMNDHIVKPFTEQRLFERIKENLL